MALFHFYEPYFVPSLMITHIIANEGIILALLSPPLFLACMDANASFQPLPDVSLLFSLFHPSLIWQFHFPA